MLVAEGYQILYNNWRPKKGHLEVDLIVKKDKTIAFVEVKTRTSQFFGEPEEYVSPDKMSNLFDASSAFLQENELLGYVDVRFDVVAILLTKEARKLVSYRHVTNAFEPQPVFYK